MEKNLAGSWLLRGGHTGPQPLLWPQQIPLVGGLQPAGDLPQVTGSLPPTTGNWPDAACAPPKRKKKQEMLGSLKCGHGLEQKNRALNRIKEKGVWKTQIPWQVASGHHSC